MWTSCFVSGWGLVKLSFLRYFLCISYYDIGVPCKLLPPCQGGGGHLSLHALFFLEFIWRMEKYIPYMPLS